MVRVDELIPGKNDLISWAGCPYSAQRMGAYLAKMRGITGRFCHEYQRFRLSLSSGGEFPRINRANYLDNSGHFWLRHPLTKGHGDIDEAPEIRKAASVNENHWMMIAGVTEKSPDKTPLVFENAQCTEFPLTSASDRKGKNVRGSTWKRGALGSDSRTARWNQEGYGLEESHRGHFIHRETCQEVGFLVR